MLLARITRLGCQGAVSGAVRGLFGELVRFRSARIIRVGCCLRLVARIGSGQGYYLRGCPGAARHV